MPWVLPLLSGAVDWVWKGSYRTAWAVPCGSSCSCSYSYGRGPAIGSHPGERCWPLPAGVWRAIVHLLKPWWCAEGEVPTAANLNLYQGWRSCVRWHCDDEPLFGECGDAKLIVSVSLGIFAVFRWRRDVLVMDGQRAIAPLMKPWCAEGDVPTAANLNLYRGKNSCVRWHCDDEPLFGRGQGTSKLIVSVSFGSLVSFKWKAKSCLNGENSSCSLGHGDILCHGWPMSGRVSSLYGSRFGTGAD